MKLFLGNVKKRWFVLYIGFIAILCASFLLGFYLTKDEELEKPITPISTLAPNDLRKKGSDDSLEAVSIAEKPVITDRSEPKVTDTTSIIYEYYYVQDGKIETSKESVPYFLIGKTHKEVEETFDDWEVRSFDSSEIVLRKNVEESGEQNYIVSEKDGYIAVFYEDKKDGPLLKEVTDMPVSIYDNDEQTRLREGIHAVGKTELVRILQDYGS